MTDRLIDFRLGRQQVGLWLFVISILAVVAFVTWRFVGTFVLGLFLYYVTRPVHRRIATRIRPRTVSVTVALVSVAIPVLILVIWTIAVALRGLRTVLDGDPIGQDIPGVETVPTLDGVVALIEPNLQEFITDPLAWVSTGIGEGILGVFEAISGSLALVVSGGLHLFIALVVVFFLLRDDYRLVAWARETFDWDDTVIEAFFRAVDRDLTQVYFGNILNAVITAALGAVSFWSLNLVAPELVRIPEPALFGLLAGVASLIPVIGIKLVWVPLAVFLLVDALLNDPTALWFVALFVFVAVVVVDTLPDQLLRPYVSGRSLHVGAVMLAYTVGPLLFGWYGVFLGPLLLIVVIEGARHVFPAVFGGSRRSEDGPAGSDEAVADEGPVAESGEPSSEVSPTGDEESDGSVTT